MNMEEEGTKRIRSSNFSQNEKHHLINIVAKYKDILENKETNKTTNIEKNLAWNKITTEFNATSPSNLERSKEVLKRFYENKKKELRKKVADNKINLKKTGGGPPKNEELEPFENVLLGIANKKTVFGLSSEYGGDITSEDETAGKENEQSNDFEIIYELKNNILSNIENTDENMNSENRASNWKKYKVTNLKEPISSPLRILQNDKKETSLEERNEQSTSRKRRFASVNRRRSNVQVKALTSSEVSEKYNLLLDKRLKAMDFTNKKLQDDIEQSREKHEREMQLIDVQIQVEKEKLNRLKRIDC